MVADPLVRQLVLAVVLTLAPLAASAQSNVPNVAPQPAAFTRADTLRGSIGPARAWWDVTFYDLHVAVSPRDSAIRGTNRIVYRVLRPGRELQIDLQAPLVMDSVLQGGLRLTTRRDGNAWFARVRAPQRRGERREVRVFYHGRPKVAKNAPWDGGVIWSRDSLGRSWVATANQGLGASVWWPNKDTQADEPDSQRVAITVPDSMTNVSNGRLRRVVPRGDGTTTWEWFVASPINNYDVAINAGRYAHWSELYQGERGALTLDFWPLAIHHDTARVQFRQVQPVLACFEHWFGPFPWYEDGFKMVETPHLGMEHQSAVAYGNLYRNGYLGRDRSGTGHGLQWDFIIVHEIAHEWWGNHVTTKDIADMWVHEAFGNYAEGLYTECQQGKAAGARFIVGNRRNVQNQKAILGPFGVNAEGSGDMYDKGGNMLHTIRQLVNDDERWRGVLRGLQRTFGRQTVTGAQVREYMSRETGLDLRRVFEQYLERPQLPVLEYRLAGDSLAYRWLDVVPLFDMPVRVVLAPGTFTTLRPTSRWQTVRHRLTAPEQFAVDESFYVLTRNADAPAKVNPR